MISAKKKPLWSVRHIAGFWLLPLILVACGKPFEVVALKAVIENPAEYSGRTIEIEGAAVVQFERYFICPDPSWVDSRKGKCVWFSANFNVDGLDHLSLMRFDKKMVRVVGRFSTEFKGHMGAYAGEIIPASVEVVGQHSAGDIPKIPPHRGES